MALGLHVYAYGSTFGQSIWLLNKQHVFRSACHLMGSSIRNVPPVALSFLFEEIHSWNTMEPSLATERLTKYCDSLWLGRG